MEARRERIAELARMLLPCVEDCRRKERRSKNLLLSAYVLFAFSGGYLVHENTRPINTNEYTVLNSLVFMQAKERNTTPELISEQIAKQYKVERLQNLKARDWRDAVNYLAHEHIN